MFVFVFLSISTLKACDACGCSGSDSGIGLMSNYKSNFLRVAVFNTRFQSNHNHDYLVKDNFTLYNLSFRYSFDNIKKFRLESSLPFGVFTRSLESEVLNNNGLGDLRVSGVYSIFDKVVLRPELSLYIEIGLTSILPTGEYDEGIHDRNLPSNFNIGRGSFGLGMLYNSILKYKKLGLVFNASCQHNFPTIDGYTFGKQFQFQINSFKEITLKLIDIIPTLGVSSERILSDTYTNGNLVVDTGGLGVFINSSINLRSKYFLTGISVGIPAYSSYSDGEVIAKNRYSFQMTYLF